MRWPITPMTPEVPFYSATLFDPRERPLRCLLLGGQSAHTVRFAASVQAALEEGYRVFAELSPHPLLTRAAEQTAESLGIPVAALAGMRREQELPHGLRGFLADLYSAGAAVDSAVLNPDGRLVDAPLPAWTNRRPVPGSRRAKASRRGARTVAVHPLMGAHVLLPRSQSATCGRAKSASGHSPGSTNTKYMGRPLFPAATYCEMALNAARTVLGEASEMCDLRIERKLLLDEQTPLKRHRVAAGPGVLDFAVETLHEGQHTRRATAVLRAAEDEPPPRVDVDGLLPTHPAA